MKAAVTYLDGSVHTVSVTPADMVRAERHYNQPYGDIPKSVEATMFLIWLASKRLGHTGAEFDAWMDGLTSFEPEADNPPRPGA